MSDITKKRIIIAGALASLAGSLFTLALALSPEASAQVEEFALQYPWALPITIVILSILGNVVPPLSTGVIVVLFIPFIGWFPVTVASVIGDIIGYSWSFFIGRRFRNLVVNLFSTVKLFNEWEARVSRQTEFWGFFVLRLATQGFGDYISYLASISSTGFSTFISSTVFSMLVLDFTRNYFLSLGFEVHPLLFALAAIPFVGGWMIQRWYINSHVK